jgi:hypothetical protein
MARCKNVTTWYVDDRPNQPQQAKVVIRCTADTHEVEEFCHAQVFDSDPVAVVLWKGTTSPKKPMSHG